MMQVDIANKWPAVRMVGPDVTEEQALDFIWKTDVALQYPQYCSNNQQFNRRLAEWIGSPSCDDRHSREVWREWGETIQKRGQIGLEHFSSHWVASCMMGGPYGPVSPNGEVNIAHNFGKWPDVGEIEKDLQLLADNFQWLSFQMALWDSADESQAVARGDEPDMGWKLHNGQFERIDPKSVFEFTPIPKSPSFQTSLFNLTRRETTWSLQALERMWGDRL